jgi:flagellar biosynthesis/type III secretory pathway protein FliH
MITTYERGKADGKVEGKAEGKLEGKVEERCEITLLLLEKRFGSLSQEVQQRVAVLTPEQLRQLIIDLMKAESLKALRLED